jgi:tRNA A-37 threonylcarbamoyl transferase component Bud32
MTLDNVQALPLGTELGDYRIDAVIGHGGFGITYRAFDGQLAKIVAIKEYLPVEFAIRKDREVVPRGGRFADDFAWGRERFLDEARALARFRHPHIVPVLRYFDGNGTAYTVMEFEDGRSVAQLLHDKGRRLPPDDVRRLAEGLLSGLGAVHAQGFLHRDIKPSNIIIRRDGVPILIDFGAARQAMGGRTRTLTSVLTPQYAPIEQFALDGKQGPWSDIYSAAAVLHHAIAGHPPPEAASRVSRDPYLPLAKMQADRFDDTFLAAIDKALAFAPEQRPQSIEAWRALFGSSLPSADEAPTQRVAAASVAAPRLGGASRDQHLAPPPPASRSLPHRSRAIIWVGLLVVAAVGVALWYLQPRIRNQLADTMAQAPASVTRPAPAPVPRTSANTATPTPATEVPAPASTEAAQKELIEQAERAAAEARGVFERAKEAASAARTLAGEARIAAARAARPGVENIQRLTSDDGTSYVGQVADGKRQGLGVVEFKDGGRQAGEWQDDLLSGLGTARLADGARYEGQWRSGQSTGLGLREKPGVDRAEGNFIGGRLDGPGMRRTLVEPSVVQAGEWHADSLDGPGVESLANGERYEGGFRGGLRHGYGQVIGPDDKVHPGRWDDGKLVESAP